MSRSQGRNLKLSCILCAGLLWPFLVILVSFLAFCCIFASWLQLPFLRGSCRPQYKVINAFRVERFISLTTLETPNRRVCFCDNNCKSWNGVNEEGYRGISLTFLEKSSKWNLQSKPLWVLTIKCLSISGKDVWRKITGSDAYRQCVYNIVIV